MAINQPARLGEKVKVGFEHVQERLVALEGEAQKVVDNLMRRGRASSKEMASIIGKIKAKELLPIDVKARAMKLGRRLDEVRSHAIALTGVATKDQVDEIARDLESLKKKLERFIKGSAKRPATSHARAEG